MAFLTDQDKQRIRDAIRAAEERTSGEIVTVIARSADDYLYIPMLWASLLALLTPSLLLFLSEPPQEIYIYIVQILVFVFANMVFRFTPLTMKLVPKAVQYRRANRLAYVQFLQQGVHRTEHRNGLLLFVSVAERYVEIMADQGINDAVPENAWHDIVQQFLEKVKQDQITEGFIGAINASGNLLHEHFPIQPNDKNELPNHLVEL